MNFLDSQGLLPGVAGFAISALLLWLGSEVFAEARQRAGRAALRLKACTLLLGGLGLWWPGHFLAPLDAAGGGALGIPFVAGALAWVLAGLAISNLGGSGDFSAHIEFGYTGMGLAGLALVLTALLARRPRRDVGITLGLLVLYVVQENLEARAAHVHVRTLSVVTGTHWSAIPLHGVIACALTVLAVGESVAR